MTPHIIILQGGEDVKKRTNESLIRKVGGLSESKRILVIPWTSDSPEKEKEYREIYRRYFSDNGFHDVHFLEKEDTDIEITEKFASVDVIYLPGGDTGVLYEEINKRSLQNRLRDFKGIIVGNSAGAIVLSKGGRGDGKFYPGLGLVDFYVWVHYNLEADPVSGSDGRLNINIPEGMWISVTGKDNRSDTSLS